jgi:excinuclease ABC subunit B
MAKHSDTPKKPGKTPKSKAPSSRASSKASSKASRPEVQPIGPALAELLNPAINRGDSGIGSSTGLQPPPDNSWDRRAGGEAAAHRARASTRDKSGDVAKRDASSDPALESQGFDEAPQANYGTSATIPTLDPELARQLGLPTAEDDEEALARPPRSKMEAFGVKATADALENLIRDGRPEFRKEDGTLKVWTPHRPPRPEKSEGGVRFVIKSDYEPKGDQPTAIADLVEGIQRNDRTQVLLGVTGSGKTYTMAKVIEATQRPALILAPNKTLAAQLYGEFKNFFPDNAVEYFVSYYDYYQPEAYVPRTDTYIEKDSSINEQIDRMRHSATRALLERDDVIIVASVSCIYGIGSVETYTAMTFALKKGERIDQRQLIADLVALQYKRTQADFTRGTFRVRGDVIDIFPAHYEDRAWRVNLFGDTVENIEEFDPLTGHKQDDLEFIKIYANSHYVTPRPTLVQAIKSIKGELKLRLDQLNNQGRLLEAQRLEQRTTFDLEMMEATGRAAADTVRICARQCTGVRRREPRHHSADRRHVPR